MVDAEVVERLGLFGGLDGRAVREIATRATTATFAAGEVLWVTGSRPRGLFVILEGEVKVVRQNRGRTHRIHTEGPGGTLGEVPLFEGGSYPATASASSDCRCLVVGREALRAAMACDPELGLRLLERMARRTRELVDRLDSTVTLDVTSRLAGDLLSRPDVDGLVTIEQSRAAWAEELGTVREVLVRSLRRLVDAGVIERVERRKVRLVDRSALEQLAAGGP